MADDADYVTEMEPLAMAASLAKVRAQQGPKLTPKGECHYCEQVFETAYTDEDGVERAADGAPVKDKLFCDSECASDHQKYVLRR